MTAQTNIVQHELPKSWVNGSQLTELSDIFAKHIHVATWRRATNPVIETYFKNTLASFYSGIRDVYSLSDLKLKMLDRLPDGNGKLDVIEDIYMLADVLTCLFDCNEVGVRLSAMDAAMCPRFHTDHIPVRLVCTYLGEGTQWIPAEWVDHSKLGHGANGKPDESSGLVQSVNDIQQMNTFEVGLLKGSAWEDDIKQAAVHRSCPQLAGQPRVLLSLDPM